MLTPNLQSVPFSVELKLYSNLTGLALAGRVLAKCLFNLQSWSCIQSSASLDRSDWTNNENISSAGQSWCFTLKVNWDDPSASVPVVYLYIWSLINVGVDNGAGQTGYWYLGCTSPYIRLSDCSHHQHHLILNLNSRWGKNTTNAHRSKLHWNPDALHPYLGYTSLYWYKCKCKGEVSTKYSSGNVKHEIKTNRRVLVSTLKFFYFVLISSWYEYKVIQIQRI